MDEEEKRRTLAAKPGSSHSNQTVTDTPQEKVPRLPSPATPGPNETPIADLYSTPSSSVLSLDDNETTAPLRPRPRPRPAASSIASSALSFNHLSMALPDDHEADDDWAQSVLAAADSDGNWSVKNAMKIFGGSG